MYFLIIERECEWESDTGAQTCVIRIDPKEANPPRGDEWRRGNGGWRTQYKINKPQVDLHPFDPSDPLLVGICPDLPFSLPP